MRVVVVWIAALACVAGLTAVARAENKLVRAYAGHIVISPDPVPVDEAQLAELVRVNLAKDRHYDLTKGPPWQVNLVGFLSKDSGNEAVTLRVTDAADPKTSLVVSRAPVRTRRLVIMSFSATTAAGFAIGKTYVFRLMLGKTVLARCELLLRES